MNILSQKWGDSPFIVIAPATVSGEGPRQTASRMTKCRYSQLVKHDTISQKL